MAILGGIPILNCHHIEDTLNFYQKYLQFVIVKKRELNGQVFWVHLMHGETTLMLQRVSSVLELTSLQNTTISLYYYVNNINDLHHLIKVNNIIVSRLLQTDYQMHEFSLIDPEGNKVTLGQKLNK